MYWLDLRVYPRRARRDASCYIVTDQHNATHSVKRASLDELEAHEADDGAVIAAQHVLAYHAVAELVFQSLRDHEIVESPETVKKNAPLIASLSSFLARQLPRRTLSPVTA